MIGHSLLTKHSAYCEQLYTWNYCARGAAVDGGDHKGERAIDVAARAGFVGVVQALLENGANANSQTNNGRSWYAHSQES